MQGWISSKFMAILAHNFQARQQMLQASNTYHSLCSLSTVSKRFPTSLLLCWVFSKSLKDGAMSSPYKIMKEHSKDMEQLFWSGVTPFHHFALAARGWSCLVARLFMERKKGLVSFCLHMCTRRTAVWRRSVREYIVHDVSRWVELLTWQASAPSTQEQWALFLASLLCF